MQNPVLTLNFHGLGPPHGDVPADELPYWATPEVFHGLLDTVVSLRAEGVDAQITFDDGNKSDLTIALPALLERGLTAVFFVCSGRLDNPLYLSVADMKALEAAGMAIGCHGKDHIRLRGLDAATLAAETTGAKSTLEAALGHSVDGFAIPFGNYDREVMTALRSYARIFTSDFQLSRPGDRIVTRHSYRTDWGPDHVATILATAPRGLKRLMVDAKLLLKRNRALI